nr:hypothetical protein [Tanacetum cinerariifolium]
MTMTVAFDTNQTTIASAGGKLRRRSILAMRNKKPNLLTKIVNKLFKTNKEPQNVHREEGQRASVSTPMVTSREEIALPVELAKAYMASRPYKVARRQDLVLHNNATKIAPKIANAVRSLEKGDSPILLSYPLNEPPLKLPAEPPHKKRTFRTSVPGSDSALVADIVVPSTLPRVSITHALVKPP